MENGLRRIPNYLLMRSEFSSLNAKAIFCINTALGKLLSWSTWPRIRRDAVKNSIRLSSVFAIITYAVEKCNFPRTLEAKGPACTHAAKISSISSEEIDIYAFTQRYHYAFPWENWRCMWPRRSRDTHQFGK